MYAIALTGGKQQKAEVGKYFLTEKIDAEVGAKVELKCLLFVDEAGNVKSGKDASDIKIVAEVLEHGKDDKITIFKYKAKKNVHRKQGHRQPYTKLKVISIGK